MFEALIKGLALEMCEEALLNVEKAYRGVGRISSLIQ
jgi:hypothetical protein